MVRACCVLTISKPLAYILLRDFAQASVQISF